jgi:hypothetical protein
MPGVITARTMAEVLPQRVVMRGRAFFVDLPKNRRSVIEHLPNRAALGSLCDNIRA